MRGLIMGPRVFCRTSYNYQTNKAAETEDPDHLQEHGIYAMSDNVQVRIRDGGFQHIENIIQSLNVDR